MERSAKPGRICDCYGTTTGPSCSHGMATSSGDDYEVFLSFRGPDTRSAFTDFLYTSLDSAGIRTYKDDEELRVGKEFAPELLQAIKQSKISIPIFSKGYASSVWCLKELVQMVECQETGRQKIMPIFYDVAPAEVRYQTGGYGEAFRSHDSKKQHDKQTIQEWRDALKKVSFLHGWDLHSKTDRREGEFAKSLTEDLFRELKKAYLVVSDYLVSVENHVDAIMEMIGAQASEKWIIGIHGMGGIGKTTIAKIIYNRLSDNFKDCCFLSNIHEMSKRKGIECLQNQLISDILKNKCSNIRTIDEGIEIIKDRLSNKRVLLLLDDVEEESHIDALVVGRDWLGRGSKIIITTRNKSILDVPEVVDCSYEISIMDPNQSLQLFSKHAFRRDSPLDEYVDLANRAIGIAGGLPLALEVIASLLSRTKKEKWDVTLKKLESVPHATIHIKLRISYDTLDIRQQHIFLDIACLFVGYEKDVMIHFWDESKFPEEALEVLQNMSLIKITEDNRVWMHDQLRDLGREIVRQESKMKIEKQSRIWNTKEALDLLRRHEGKTKVEALRLELDHEGQYHFTYEDFKRLSNLRFLEVDGLQGDIIAEERLLWDEWASNGLPTNVFQENSNLLPQLRWLSWSNIPPKFNITNFSMEDVVILDLSNSEITDDWKGWSGMKVMKNLKILDLSYCTWLKRTPNFSAHPNLERLILEGCESLIELDKSICQLKRLVFLSLWCCTLLERLPDTIGNLESLIELNISNTRIEELPDSIGKLKKLKVLQMAYSKIRKIPDAFWMIEKLEEIEASGDILEGHQLQGNIDSCIYGNKSLRILKLRWMDIYALPRLPNSLIELELSRLYMDTFPDLSNLANLKELDLWFHSSDSHGLVEYSMPQWIGNLTKLETLALCCHFVTTSPIDLNLPSQLKSLNLNCPNLSRLPTLPSSLSSLHLKGYGSIRSMEDLSNLKNLSSLTIEEGFITEIPGLDCLENLEVLHLCFLRQVQILPDLGNLNKLTTLRVRYCDDLVVILGELPQSLEELHINHCESLLKLPDLSNLKGLQNVVIRDCDDLGFKLPQSLEIEGFSL